MKDLAVGDEVEWNSQGHGTYHLKRGKIIEVVGPSELPKKFTAWGRSDKPRGEVSFVVEVTRAPGEKGKRLYWPLSVYRAGVTP